MLILFSISEVSGLKKKETTDPIANTPAEISETVRNDRYPSMISL